MAKETGLGKGVGLLFETEDNIDENGNYFLCDIEKIIPNKYQPRIHFKDEDIEALSKSIAENGIIQPLIVKKEEGGVHELIAGERRLRASRLIGLSEVPVVINEVEDDNVLLELALVENIQRTDLNAIEEAEAYNKLIEKFNYTQEQAAKRVGKNRSTVANALRLLKLPKDIQKDVITEKLSEGHARSLLRLTETPALLSSARDEVVFKKMSVRQTEQLVKRLLTRDSEQKVIQQKLLNDDFCDELITQLSSELQANVSIKQKGNRGEIVFSYSNKEEFDHIVKKLQKN